MPIKEMRGCAEDRPLTSHSKAGPRPREAVKLVEAEVARQEAHTVR